MDNQAGRPKNEDDAASNASPVTHGSEEASVKPVEVGGAAAFEIVEHDHPAKHQSEAEQQAEITNKALVERINRSDRWMIGLTAVIAIGGLISAIIFGGQLYVMKSQLEEMQSTGRQTDEMIAATKLLAKAASDHASAAM